MQLGDQGQGPDSMAARQQSSFRHLGWAAWSHQGFLTEECYKQNNV